MKTIYAKIESSNYQSAWQVFTSSTKKSAFIATDKKYSSKEEAMQDCIKNNYKVVK